MTIEKIRQQYLKHILEEEYDNNRASLAKKLNIAPTTLNKYLSSGKYRPISDRTARQFEKKLNCTKNAFDYAYHRESINIYYVRVTFSGGHPHEFLCSLHRHSIVKEASAQYGESDIFIKIEATEEEYQCLTFNNIRLFPGVIKTTTSQALNTSRWQRSQAEYFQIASEKQSPHKVVQRYIYSKRKELYDELQMLDKGNEIIVHSDDINPLNYQELLENADDNIKMSLFYNHRTQDRLEEELLKYRAKTKPEIQYRILLITNERISSDLYQKLKNFTEKLEKDRNTKVYTIEERDWTSDRLERNGITLTIVDDLVVSILNRRSFTLGFKPEVVSRYNKIFARNWKIAKYPTRFYK
ncbi:MAG: hypothetical protein DSZ29_07210 [Aquificaceae bacterium]|nr:MAG: hypothetical protein DSZ29_07210 [Aquificaceae bacterium]